MVQYDEYLIRKLEKSLRDSFNQPLLSLTRAGTKRGAERGTKRGAEIRITLTYGSSTARTDDGTEYSVYEVLTDDNRRSGFWFGFVAVFTQIDFKKHGLHHASLLVFHDIKRELVPLFRAEWDRDAASSEASKHAQPHWHFVQNPGRIERLIQALASPPGGAVEEFAGDRDAGLFDGIADCGRIHFAMTSLWEKSETPPYIKQQFDSTNFPKWFNNLANYISGQITYIVMHMSLASAPTVKPFVPTEAEQG
jgi:hypothetical protein